MKEKSQSGGNGGFLSRRHMEEKEEEKIMTKSRYHRLYMPKVTTWGEVLLSYANMCRDKSRPTDSETPQNKQKTRKDSSPSIRPALLKLVGAAFVCLIVGSCCPLSLRQQQLITGLQLVVDAALTYLLASYALMHWGYTAEIGLKLCQRAVGLSYNWENYPLRSFLELCCWILFVFGSYAALGSVLSSVVLGTVGGMLAAIIGDIFLGYIHFVQFHSFHESEQQQVGAALFRHGLLGLCVGYVIVGILRLCYNLVSKTSPLSSEDGPDFLISYLLLLLVGISLTVASELLMLYGPTRSAGILLQSRLINIRQNFVRYPFRSVFEVICLFISMYNYFNYFKDILISLQLGTLSAIFLVLFVDKIYSILSKDGHQTVYSVDSDDHWSKILPLICLLSYIGIPVFDLVICNLQTFLVFFCLLLVTVLLLLSLSILLRICGSTSSSGYLLYSRLLNIQYNSQVFPVRTAMELSGLGLVVYGVYGYSFGLITYFQIATILGVLVVGFTEYLKQVYLTNNTASSSKSLARDLFCALCLCGIVCLTSFTNLNSKVSSDLSIIAVLVGVGFSCCGMIWSLWRPTGVISVAPKCNNFLPVSSLVEIACFIGIFFHTYAYTSNNILLSSIIAILCKLSVFAGSFVFEKKLRNSFFRNNRKSSLMIPSLFVLFATGYVATLVSFGIYYNIHSIEVGFCLTSLSGIAFVAASELFILWKPTRLAGNILQGRILHARQHWTMEPMRSFVEVGCWLGMIYGSFALSNSLLLSLQLGTFSGVVVTLSGEFFRSTFILSANSKTFTKSFKPAMIKMDKAGQNTLNKDVSTSNFVTSHKNSSIVNNNASQSAARPKSLPFVLLLAYIGIGTFHWIFDHFRVIEISLILATVAGVAFVSVADILVWWQPTRVAGILLQDRFLDWKYNWCHHPLRSFVEVGCWLGVIYGSFAIYHDLAVAVQFGTLSGMLVTLIGEFVKQQTKLYYPHFNGSANEGQEKQRGVVKILPLPMIALFGILGAILFNTIYTHLHSIEIAFVLATFTGVAFTLMGDVFVIWPPTRILGLILQQRIVNLWSNITEDHPTRTWFELAATAIALFNSYRLCGDWIIAIEVGTVSGIIFCVADDMVLQSIYMFEAKKGNQLQTISCPKLLELPYEVLFETARFLTPEELLVTRTTCHRVNNMLRGEASRFWLHTKLRSSYLKLKNHNSSPSGDHVQQVRFLIYELLQALKPTLMVAREPSTILHSDFSTNRILRWVYSNAGWIRKHKLPIIDSQNTITLLPSDVGFPIFRYIPDKQMLGIKIVRNEGLNVVKIEIPYSVYSKIQADPFSFVAHEALSDIDVLSTYQLVSVIPFAVVVICFSIGLSDVVSYFKKIFSWE